MQATRKHWLAACGLLGVTTGLGTVAHGNGRSAVAPPRTTRASVTAAASGPISFHAALDRTAVLQGHDGTVRVELTIGSENDPTRHSIRRPTDLVIVLDRSGSMDGEKMENARAAIRELLTQLGPQDRFGMVTYSDNAQAAIPLTAADEGNRRRWLSTVEEITPQGGTNMASGLDLGLDLISRARTPERIPHLILISDGLANQGDYSQEGLVGRAKRAALEEYMLSTVGVGSEFNEFLMTALAESGTGNYYYLQHSRGLSDVFARELDVARTTIARGLLLRIRPAAGVQVVDATGYAIEQDSDDTIVRPGSLFSGQQRHVWLTLRVPHDVVGEKDLGQITLSYENEGRRSVVELPDLPRVACVNRPDEFYSRVDASTWGRSVVVDTYNKMQEEVARDVKEGQKDKALQRLRAFKDETAQMNRYVASASVAQQLKSADHLEAKIAESFAGSDQSVRQNELSKGMTYEARKALTK